VTTQRQPIPEWVKVICFCISFVLLAPFVILIVIFTIPLDIWHVTRKALGEEL
jgi:hypothetical protein